MQRFRRYPTRDASATSIVTQYELEGMFTEADFTFKNTPEFRALGVAMEDHLGVVVDNFSLRETRV